ncbi:hypothetical protein M427DRAFT_65805 [Gonapodya prolifera JEL478]|uniref:TPR-like protein n=1 Tax=Gonapodya prolifera (strain JEL478) TaxID=1344416 RepID=A0A139AYU1_GONPJ|nr:hypothetical protein M427DRAFT_65805 [Gonapodya prolifera JEL478]|eukprot:KXS21896.1 hypothetical protein M427DRAFT_65805 [Gonapodya prolifera JEL478]
MESELAFAAVDDEESLASSRVRKKKSDGESPAQYVPRCPAVESQFVGKRPWERHDASFASTNVVTEVREIADFLYLRRQYRDALELIREFRSYNSQRRKPFSTKEIDEVAARCEGKLGNWSSAVMEMEKLANLENEPGLFFFHGCALGNTGRYRDALSILQKYSDLRGDYLVWLKMSEIVQQWAESLAAGIGPIEGTPSEETSTTSTTPLLLLCSVLHATGVRLLMHSISPELPASRASDFRARHLRAEVARVEKAGVVLAKAHPDQDMKDVRVLVVQHLSAGGELGTLLGEERALWFVNSKICDEKWWDVDRTVDLDGGALEGSGVHQL